MMVRSRYFWPLLAAVALVQIGVLGKIVADRITVLKTGREVVLPVRPVDPRDFLRGDYVVLGFDLSTVTLTEAELGQSFDAFRRGQEVYVTWKDNGDGSWSVARIGQAPPEAVEAGSVSVRARLENLWRADKSDRRTFALRYGIESYFVPEGTGKDLEQAVRDKKIEAIVAVGGDGTAALKGLVIGGERHLDPPLL